MGKVGFEFFTMVNKWRLTKGRRLSVVLLGIKPSYLL